MSSAPCLGSGDGRLGFVSSAERAFEFLARLGLGVVQRTSTLVRFEGGEVFVNVYHGRRSYQVGLELGRVHDNRLYSLHEVLQAAAPEEVGLARCQATDEQELVHCLDGIAEVLARRCQLLLAGDVGAFGELDSIASGLRRAATLQAQFGATMQQADLAWENKDFAEAKTLYSQSEEGLSATQLRRLEYLKRKAT